MYNSSDSHIPIFVIDNNSERKTSLVEILNHNHFQVHSCESYEEVVSELSENPPKLLITAINIGKKSGWDLCKLIKDHSEFHFPVIVLGENEVNDKVLLKLSRADEYVPFETVFSQEFVEYLRKVYKTFQEKNKSKNPSFSFSGRLSKINIGEIVQSLSASKRTGCLHAQRNTLLGKIFFYEGNIYHIEISSFSGQGALYYILSWEKGSFKFKDGEESSEITNEDDMHFLLFEGMRIQDEINRIKKSLKSTPISGLLILEILLFTKKVELEDIFSSLDFLIENGGKISLPQFLIDNNLVTDFEIEETKDLLSQLHAIDTSKMATLSRNKIQITPLEETLLQRLIFSMSLLSMEQLDTCLKEKDNYSKDEKNLGQIAIRKGFLAEETIANLLVFKEPEGKDLIHGYTISHKVAQGAKSLVYKAKRNFSSEDVAIKIFIPNWEGRDNYVERLTREAEIASKLDHPNIIKTSDFGEANGFYYLVSEFVAGKSLNNLIEDDKFFSEEKFFSISSQIAKALQYIWKKGYVHRDIKPSNILVSDEVVTICDCGLTKDLAENSHNITMDGAIVGTPGYIAPESYQNHTLSFQSDIYSFGMTLYAILSQKNITDRVGTRLEFPKNTPKYLIHLVNKFTHPDPKVRALAQEEILQDIEDAKLGKSPQRYKSDFRKPKLLHFIAVFSLIFLGIIVFYASAPKKEKAENLSVVKNVVVTQAKTKTSPEKDKKDIPKTDLGKKDIPKIERNILAETLENKEENKEENQPKEKDLKQDKIETLTWLTKKSLLHQDYLTRLQSMQALSGNWAPAEDKQGVFGFGTGELAYPLKKQPWKTAGKISFDLGNQEGGVALHWEDKIIIFSFQLIQNDNYLVVIGESPSFEEIAKRKVIYSKVIQSKSKKINYMIFCKNGKVAFRAKKIKTIVKIQDFPKTLAIFTKKAKGLYFEAIEHQYANVVYK